MTERMAAKAKTKGKAAVEKQAQKLERLAIEYLPVDSIQPNAYNPNRQSDHDFQLLLKSMSEDGFTQPVVAIRVTQEMKDEGDDAVKDYNVGDVVIVDGEHRWRASRELGYTEIPVAIVPMSLTQARIATLRHNRARGSEDVELSAQLLRDLQSLGAAEWAMDSLEMDDAEFSKLVDDIPAPEALAGDDFGQAWAPASAAGSSGEDGQTEVGGNRTMSSTQAAADAQRDREKRIREAKTEEERVAASRDKDVYRLVLTYQDDEAATVKEILTVDGSSPAEILIALCEAAKNGEVYTPKEPAAA